MKLAKRRYRLSLDTLEQKCASYEVLASLDQCELNVSLGTPKLACYLGVPRTVAGLSICQLGSCLGFAKLIELLELEVNVKLIAKILAHFSEVAESLNRSKIAKKYSRVYIFQLKIPVLQKSR